MTSKIDPHLRLRVDAVRGAMAACGIRSNEALAARLGLSLSTVKRVMSGRQEPSGPFIAAVAVHLGIAFDVFLEAQATTRQQAPKRLAAA